MFNFRRVAYSVLRTDYDPWYACKMQIAWTLRHKASFLNSIQETLLLYVIIIYIISNNYFSN